MSDSNQAGRQFMTAFVRRDYERCIELYSEIVEADPRALILALPFQVFLISCQRQGLPELAEHFADQDLARRRAMAPMLAFPGDFLEWEARLIELTLGRRSPEDVLPGAKTDAQRARVHYYAAARALTAGDPAGASALLEACLAVPDNFPERELAQAEMHALRCSAMETSQEQFTALVGEGRWADAVRVGRRWVEQAHAQFGTNSPHYCVALKNLADVTYLAGDYPAARELWREFAALFAANVGEDTPEHAETLGKLAHVTARLGGAAEAGALHARCEAILARLGDGDAEARAHLGDYLHELGKFLDDGGDYLRAETLYRRALEVRRAALGADDPNTVTSLIRLADLMRVLGRDDAGPLLREALDAAVRHAGEGTAHHAARLNSLGLYHMNRGELREAERYLRQTLKVRREAQGADHPDCAEALGNLGQLYRIMGDLAAAAALTEQAADGLRPRAGTDRRHATYLANLANIYALAGQPARAEGLLRQAVDAQRAAVGERHPDYLTSVNNLAVCLFSQGQAAPAEALLRGSLRTIRDAGGEESPQYAMTLHSLVPILIERGDHAGAEELARDSLDRKRRALGEGHPELVPGLHNLAVVCDAAGRPRDAWRALQEIVAIEDDLIAQAFGLGSSRQRLKHLATPHVHLDMAFTLLLRRGVGGPAETRAAWDLVLRRKGIAADAAIAQRDAALEGKYPHLAGSLRRAAELRWELARRALAGEGPEASPRAALELEHLEAALARGVPEIDLRQRLRAVDGAAVAGLLPPGSVLVEFVRYRCTETAALARGDVHERYAAFVAPAGDPNGVRALDIGAAGIVERELAAFRADLAGGEAGRNLKVVTVAEPTAPDSGERLRKLLLDPLPVRLAGGWLILAPDGDLTRLPFAALPHPDGGYLGDHARFSYVSTGRDLLRFGKAQVMPRAPVVVAAPDFDLGSPEAPPGPPDESLARQLRRDAHFTPLPGTRLEALRVGGMLGVAPLEGTEATEARVKAVSSPLVLHLATHGFFLEGQAGVAGTPLARLLQPPLDNPLLRSGLALAGANAWLAGRGQADKGEDGILTAEDVAGLDLADTGLVVLSACDTGLGEVRRGEGVFGLRRAFHLAGARTLLMSLWKVSDLATALLMERYYDNLLHRRLGRAEALDDAQRQLRTLTVRHLRSTWLSPQARAELPPTADALRCELDGLAACGDDARPFAAPYYWAAFIVQGEPGPLSTVGLPGGYLGKADEYRAAPTAERPAPVADVGAITRLNTQAIHLAQQGRLAEALPLARQAVEQAERLGPHDRELGASLNVLAGIYQAQGRFVDAEHALRRALEVAEHALGKDHPTYGVALGNLAGIYRRRGHLRQALPLLVEDVEVLSRTLGREELDTQRAANYLAQVHAALGDEAAAEELLGLGLAVLRSSLSERHPLYQGTLQAVAKAYLEGGRPAAAVRWLKELCRVRSATLGEGRPGHLDALAQLAAAQGAAGEFGEAEQTLAEAATQVPPGDERGLDLRRLAATVALKRGDFERAERECRAWQEEMRRRGAGPLAEADATLGLAEVALARGDRAGARSLLERAVEALPAEAESALPEKWLMRLAELCLQVEIRDRAETILEGLMRRLAETVGEGPALARCLRLQARLRRSHGGNEEARVLEERGAALLRDCLGDAHPALDEEKSGFSRTLGEF